jgi:hypothetical protein
MAIEKIAIKGKKAVLHLTPRFAESDGVWDRLDNGKIIHSIWDKNPNYGIIDVFSPEQRAKSIAWLEQAAKRYGRNRRVVSFTVGWGFIGETGFYAGDWFADIDKPETAHTGSECAGYSQNALRQFNRWRAKKGFEPVNKLPLPSTKRQSQDYILFHRFRCEFIREVLHREMIAAVKTHTDMPVGIRGYLSAFPDSYARNWVDAPNADYYLTAGSSSTFDMTRTLIDSGIGWEDNVIHDGKWDYSSACMFRDEVRQIARGGVFHAMVVREYKEKSQWEQNLFKKIAKFLKTQNIESKIHREKPTVALYQPTWGIAALPARSEKQKFLPRWEHSMYVAKMTGLVESFGLPYQLVTEADLLEPQRIDAYRFIIVPMWDIVPRIIGKGLAERYSKDRRVIKVLLKNAPFSRSEFRELLKIASVPISLDFDSDMILAGRYANLVYNWGRMPLHFRMRYFYRRKTVVYKTNE